MNDIREGVLEYTESELVIGLVSSVGTDMDAVTKVLTKRLKQFSYSTSVIHISKDVIPEFVEIQSVAEIDKFALINELMDAGNQARRQAENNAALALGVAAKISQARILDKQNDKEPKARQAYIIRSLKRPEEVKALRNIYGEGFYLLGLYEEAAARKERLTDDERMSAQHATKLLERDESELGDFGQKTRDTYHLSDFFVKVDDTATRLKNSIQRILEILFGHPYRTPTFDEFAMFMAFSSALRSADLSRQVGAVIARDDEIIGTGANDCPRSGGGLYWPKEKGTTGEFIDAIDGRDYKRGKDSNKDLKDRIVNEITKKITTKISLDIDTEELKEVLYSSMIKDITEYGRVVHAEMEAILSCARNNVSCSGATLYCTTFPCHNCAKHIIAAGIRRVVYVEPYPKSRAMEFHKDAIALDKRQGQRVLFESFVGVSARRFSELFSMGIGSGKELIRKDNRGKKVDFDEKTSVLRVQMLPYTYLEKELFASEFVNFYRGKEKNEDKP